MFGRPAAPGLSGGFSRSGPPWPRGGSGGASAPRPSYSGSFANNLDIGATLTGTVKSYSAKGFGFILCNELDTDVYFPKESLQAGLRTCNIAGTAVTFELVRGPAGKPQARNLRPIGSVLPNIQGQRPAPRGFSTPPPPASAIPGAGMPTGSGIGMRPGFGPPSSVPAGGVSMVRPGIATGSASEPARNRDWSPHAGSRAIAGRGRKFEDGPPTANGGSTGAAGDDASSSSSSRRNRRRSRSRSRRKTKRRKKKRESSDSSGGSSSASSSSSPQRSKSRSGERAPAAATEDKPVNPEVEAAKQEALQKLQQLRAVEPKEARMKEWRALLRAWHPDKNPERTEVATEVFQFLQKGKLLIDSK